MAMKPSDRSGAKMKASSKGDRSGFTFGFQCTDVLRLGDGGDESLPLKFEKIIGDDRGEYSAVVLSDGSAELTALKAMRRHRLDLPSVFDACVVNVSPRLRGIVVASSKKGMKLSLLFCTYIRDDWQTQPIDIPTAVSDSTMDFSSLISLQSCSPVSSSAAAAGSTLAITFSGITHLFRCSLPNSGDHISVSMISLHSHISLEWTDRTLLLSDSCLASEWIAIATDQGVLCSFAPYYWTSKKVLSVSHLNNVDVTCLCRLTDRLCLASFKSSEPTNLAVIALSADGSTRVSCLILDPLMSSPIQSMIRLRNGRMICLLTRYGLKCFSLSDKFILRVVECLSDSSNVECKSLMLNDLADCVQTVCLSKPALSCATISDAGKVLVLHSHSCLFLEI